MKKEGVIRAHLEFMKGPFTAPLPSLTTNWAEEMREFVPKITGKERVMISVGSRPSIAKWLGSEKITKEIHSNLFFHEVSEAAQIIRKLRKVSPETLIEKGPTFGSHYGAGVIVDEILFAMKTGGKKGFETAKRLRDTEVEYIKKQSLLTPEIQKYIDRTQKIYSTMEKNWLPKFTKPSGYISYVDKLNIVSEPGNWYFPEQYKVGVVESARGQIGKLRGDMAWENWLTAHYDPLEKKMMEKPIASVKQLSKSPITRKHLKWLAAIGGALYLTHKIFGKDDKHNTIEGFQELGLASKMRKRDTAFGSGWDAIRGMAKTAGISFEKFIAKKSFQEALSSAVVKETFRPGSFGSAHLMKTEFRGQKFEFVKKVLHSEEEMVAKQVGLGVKKETIVGEIASRGGRENMAKAEAEVTRMFGEKFAPSIYRQEGGEIFMEHMPGESISAAIKAGKVSKQQLTTEMTSHIKDLSEKGVYNADIHAGNIRHFVDPTKGTSHVVWIDYGEAQRMGAGSIADAGFLSQLMHKEMKGKLMAKLAKDYPAQMASKQMSPLRLAPEAEDLIEQSGSSIKSKIIRKKPVVPMKRLPPGPKQVPRPRPSTPPAEGYEKFRSIIASRFEENQAIAYGKTRIADTVLASQDLQRAQEQIWINIGGSRNHVKRRSSRSVVSLSRFDKSVK